MTPFELDILLHYYACCDDHPVVLNNPPIWWETRQWMLDEGLLVVANAISSYKIGERGKVLIDHITNLPLPVWRMP